MKIVITFLFLACSITMTAQLSLDTIYANDKKNVALFFHQPIRQAITGSGNFIFTYNREKEQYFGLLQAKPGDESNLLVINNDGSIFSYIVSYKKQLSKLNYFIPDSKRIGNERPKSDTPITKNSMEDIYANKLTYFQKFSEHVLALKSERIATKRKNGIRLQLQKMIYYTSEVYLVIEIDNKSGIDFEIDYLNIYRTNGNKMHKASFQELQQKVIYKHKMPYSIKNKQKQRFVYVLPKFVLGDNEKLTIELKELKGSRSVILRKKL